MRKTSKCSRDEHATERPRARELAELAAMVAAYGPVWVLGNVAHICEELGAQRGSNEIEMEAWEGAALAVRKAVLTIVRENGLENPEDPTTNDTHEGDDEQGNDDGDNATEDRASDDDDGEEDDEDDGDRDDANEGDDEGESDEDGDENEDDDESADGTPAEPATEPRAEGRGEEEATQARAHVSAPTREDTKTMARDERLGPRPANAAYWRCFRADSTKRAGIPLTHTEGGFGTNEWPIRNCSASTIADRWGDGTYVVQYILIDEAGRRRPCGRSKVLTVVGRGSPRGEDAPEEDAAPAATPPAVAPPSRALAVAMAPPPVAQAGGDTMFANVFSLMAFMQEQSERARASAASDAKAALERASLEARLAAEKHRADREFELERMRMESAERVAAIQAQARSANRRGPSDGRFDADELATKIGAVVGAKVQEVVDDLDDEDDAEPAPPQDTAATIAVAVKDTLQPLIVMLGTYLSQQAAQNTQRLGEATGTADAAE